jgi:hypothetical protein
MVQKDPKMAFAMMASDAWQDLVDGVRNRVSQVVLGELPPMALR